MVACTYPPALAPGSTVAILASSHAPPEAAFSTGIERLEAFGLGVEVFETARRDTEWLRANPEARAADVEEAFADDGIDGVIAAMGGNRGLQTLEHVDETVLRENPKRFFGTSDNTHLHLLLNRLGIVSFYGGQLFPDLSTDPEIRLYTREYVERAFGDASLGPIEPAGEWTDEYDDLGSNEPREWFPGEGWIWHNPAGEIRGSVLGGCFAMLESQLMLADTPFPAVLDPGDVFAVETSGEVPNPAEVERFFTVLGERGVLADLGAVLVGRPETPGGTLSDREDYRRDQRETIARVVDEYTESLPVVFDLDFGHTAPNLPLSLGAPIVIDSEERSITFPAPEAEPTIESGG
ncbi:carboxypeptidase [Halobacteriales archaeon QS_3_64_16]|nr:MAG: carboxypeptidase [Halobacteriales archaeon QS_3_64_16]